MEEKVILFDLDGTLTDSGEGIMNCAQLALEHFGLPVPSREQMRVFVGPPLAETFIKFGVPPHQTDEAISVFRSRYIPIGIFENKPYPGIRSLLESLRQRGHRLFVATSKPEEMAVTVLKHFEMAHFFERICGATFDEKRVEKAEIIAYLLEQTGVADHAIMVGDTAFDVIGAAAHGIPAVGVTWGYGTEESMQAAGAAAIIHKPSELLTLLHP